MWSKFSPVRMATSNLSAYFNFRQIKLFNYTSGWLLIIPKMTDRVVSTASQPDPYGDGLVALGLYLLALYKHGSQMWGNLIYYFHILLGFVWLHFRGVQYSRTLANTCWSSLELWYQILTLPIPSLCGLRKFTWFSWGLSIFIHKMALSIAFPQGDSKAGCTN